MNLAYYSYPEVTKLDDVVVLCKHAYNEMYADGFYDGFLLFQFLLLLY
jgi:hypothetical protein